MRLLCAMGIVTCASAALAAEPAALPADVPSALVWLDQVDADLQAYENDPEAMAAAPDAVRQARDASAEIRQRLPETGPAALEAPILRLRELVKLIAELIEARSLERTADRSADDVVEALERVAVARAALERVTEQLHLYAVPMPGEAGL